MPRPWRLRYEGAVYHLTQRGNGGARVFFGDDDRVRFLEQLDYALEQHEVRLFAYCLMPNHYHLFVETPLGNVHRFMQSLNTAYAMYFRYKHKRPGHCWQGRYGAKLVRGDKYIIGVTRYIHLNPVKGEAWEGRSPEDILGTLENYEWSSYRGYAGHRAPEERIDYRWLGLMGKGSERRKRTKYRKYVEQMACRTDDEFLKDSGLSRYAIGDEEYREEVAEHLKARKMERAVTGDILWPEDRRPGIETLESAVVRQLGISREKLHSHGRCVGWQKSLAIEICCEQSGASQREVGQYFGYSNDSGVSRQRKRWAALLASDKALSRRAEHLTRRIIKYIVQV